MVLKLTLILLLNSCLKVEEKIPQEKAVALTEVSEIVPNLPIVNTAPPEFKGAPLPFFSNKFRLTFPQVPKEQIAFKDITIIGKMTEAGTVSKINIKSNVPEWSDGNKHTYFITTPEHLNFSFDFEITQSKSFSINEIQLTPRFFSGEENIPSHFIFEAKNLTTDRIDLWSPHLPTRFVIISPGCPLHQVPDHLGNCQNKKIYCSDIQTQFNDELFKCVVKIENEDILCMTAITESECRMKLYLEQNVSYCDVYKEYLFAHSSRLEVFFKERKVFEQFCSTPTQSSPEVSP